MVAIAGCSSGSSDEAIDASAETDATNQTSIGDAEAGYEFMKTNCLPCHSMPSRPNFSNRDTDDIIKLLAEHNGLSWPESDAINVAAWVHEGSAEK